jgi:hypothetical protein
MMLSKCSSKNTGITFVFDSSIQATHGFYVSIA